MVGSMVMPDNIHTSGWTFLCMAKCMAMQTMQSCLSVITRYFNIKVPLIKGSLKSCKESVAT